MKVNNLYFLKWKNIFSKKEFNPKWILENNAKIFDKNQKNFPNEVLAFLTPWNKEGFKYVEQYIEKIDFVSPVWFNMKSITIGKSKKKILVILKE